MWESLWFLVTPGFFKEMEVLLEKVAIYGIVGLVVITILVIYLRKLRKETQIVEEKIRISKEEGLHEPVSLHPVVNPNSCIKTGACILACPEKDILGISNGRATIINASRCIGHGACFHACPVEAITLCIGTEKRGVDLPHVNQNFETNVSGIYIAGEMGGMGLIRNAVEQGKQAVENLAKTLDKHAKVDHDLVIIGAGPAGISATLQAKKLKLKTITLEQDSLGGTVFTFPRSKIVMTAPMDLPLHGKVKLFETKKVELLDVWNAALSKNNIRINERSKVIGIHRKNGHFMVETANQERFNTQKILLAIGRRGSPRKLNVPGEESEKVAYRLLEPELIQGKRILVVGGGDSAIESALLLADQNEVSISYRKDVFSRLKPKNSTSIREAMGLLKVKVYYNTEVESIEEKQIHLKDSDGGRITINNDLVYIFAGGELPTKFLEMAGITITRKFGEAILSH